MKKLEKENFAFIKNLQEKRIKSVNFIIIGNSLASGYTISSKIKLFFDRNKNLFEELKKAQILYNTYHFAQPYNNSNRVIFNWIQNNQTQKEVLNQQTKHYFSGPRKEIDKHNINQKDLENYFKENIKKDQGVKDLIKNQKRNSFNIIIFLGNTGAIMDKLTDIKITTCLKSLAQGYSQDLFYLKKIIKYIHQLNNKSLVLVIGIPYHRATPFIVFNPFLYFINQKIKKITQKYHNIFFSKGGFGFVKKYQIDSQKIIDCHPDDNSYVNMLSICMQSLNKAIKLN